MLIYYIILGLLLIAWLISNLFVETKIKKVLNIIFTIIVFALIGLRDVSVGADTSKYESLYKSQYEWTEVGYNLIVFVFNYLKIDFRIFLIVLTIFAGVSFYYFCSKYSKDYLLTLIFFITIGLFSMYMTGIRQVIAITIIIWAIECIIQKKLLGFVLLVLLASKFHSSAILVLPIYFFRIFNINRKNIKSIFLIFIFMFIFSIIFQSQLLTVAEKFVPKSYDDIELTSYKYVLNPLVLIVEVSITIFILIFAKNSNIIENEKICTILLILQICNVLIQTIFSSVVIVVRVSYYFDIAKIILITYALKYFNKRKDYILVSLIIVLLCILKFSISIPGAYSKIDEYKFFFNLLNN